MASNRSTKSRGIFNFTNPALILILWDIFIGLPIAYVLAHINKRIFQSLGYEKFMRRPAGIRLNQAIFVLANVWLVVGWGWQLMQEAKAEREESVRRIKKEIKHWDEEIERLHELLDEKQIDEQLKGRLRPANEGGEEKKVKIVDCDIRWVKKNTGKFITQREVKKSGSLTAWKKGLREPSPFSRP